MNRALDTGSIGRFALARTRARARWVVKGIRWAWKVSYKKVRSVWHGCRRSTEGVRNATINTAKSCYRALRRPARAASRRQAQIAERWRFYRIEWGIEHEIERLVARDRLLIVGPWLSEVGFETLYWIPFLHWLEAAFHINPDRVVAVSRGGVGGWYQGVASRYIEIWDEMEAPEFARRNAERGVTKHYEPSPLDRDILDIVARRIGTSDFDVVHPGLMYRLFTLYWSGQRAMGFMDAHLRFHTMAPPPEMIDPALLPKEYVAVKFYAARSMPDTPDVRAHLRSIVQSLSERIPVVLLDTGLVLEDDHADYMFAASPAEARSAKAAGRVVSARSWMMPRNNLGVQTQIVAGAKAFVGTCGSIAWLAPRLGVDTSGLFVDPKWLHAHVAVAMRAYHRLNAGRFAIADLRAINPLGSLGAVAPPPGHIDSRA
ncbi:MAG TPA: hypothetical protein VKB50_29090 [Vicinamibacterales bacterium]|nr:hypothetical protein [Vicinamibacterales bacterium]